MPADDNGKKPAVIDVLLRFFNCAYNNDDKDEKLIFLFSAASPSMS
jgi:hypothetical protein